MAKPKPQLVVEGYDNLFRPIMAAAKPPAEPATAEPEPGVVDSPGFPVPDDGGAAGVGEILVTAHVKINGLPVGVQCATPDTDELRAAAAAGLVTIH